MWFHLRERERETESCGWLQMMHSNCSLYHFPTMAACKRTWINAQHPPKPLLTTSIFFIFFLILTLLIPSATSLSFNFTSFTPNTTQIVLEGDASTSNSSLQLTVNQQDKPMNESLGRATYAHPMHLWDHASRNLVDFTTTFSFSINSRNSSNFADGFVFFLAASDFPFPDVRYGGGLGLVDGIGDMHPFVAVEFDTFSNEWDPKGTHVGIDINNMKSVSNTSWMSTVLDGKRVDALIHYNSSSKNLSVSFTGFRGNVTIQQSLNYEVDLRNYLPEWVKFGFSGATGSYYELHTIYSWEFSSTSQMSENFTNGNKKREGLVVGLGVGGGVLIGMLCLAAFGLWKRKFKGENEANPLFDEAIVEEFEKGTGPRKFSYRDLARATKNFSPGTKLGQGGFGGVYRGFLKELNSHVAVKRVSKDSRQGAREYAAEIRIISRLRHRNLVQLFGWCHEKKELLLVYEFMPNGSLDSHMFNPECTLTWAQRYRIAHNLASALLYLHEEWEQCVVHRDIKSSNVMLDSNFNAKLGDFGLARLVDHARGARTTAVAGTMGYMAPECITTGRASKESDVFSFGIVALELACGRKPIDPNAEESEMVLMAEWAWDLYGRGRVLEAADARLHGDFDEREMECLVIVGLWCAHPDQSLRPSVREAIQVLNFEAPLPMLPSKMPVPTYLAPLGSMPAVSFPSSLGTGGGFSDTGPPDGSSYNSNNTSTS
ncbi:L-type lectin-domain containing receptor kinase IX.1-like [Malania oleifera]|uniref:L-type lectin-domain containing receptor kinase IX.1-like n=1 Tax=Malania oleifera TaxID=397392 RepID=UPI0025AE8A6D|nr:L-type lectin-domain containing receptor kinase IX.1-like [Malania oleifera]